MKKYWPLLIIPLVLVMLIMIIIKDEEKAIDKIITVNTSNNYLYDLNQTIDLNFYTNNKDLPLDNINAYNNFYLSNYNESKVLSLELEDVYYSHSEKYLKENYLNYIFKFIMPNLETDFYIDEAYLNFSLANDISYKIKVGTFNLIYLKQSTELNWKSLDSKKKSTEDHSISKILIELNSNLNSNIEVTINNIDQLNYEYSNNILTIYLESKDLFINNLPIIIRDSKYCYHINNTYYLKEYALLTKAYNLINVYEFN